MRKMTQRGGRRLRAALAVLAVAGIGITATSAAFTDTTETTTNVTTGQVSISATGEVAGVFNLSGIDTSNIMPGWSGSQTFDIANTSTGAVLVDLTSGAITNPGLTAALNIEIRETNAAGAVLYAQGPLSSAAFNDLAIAQGGSKTLWVRLSAPAGLSSALSGQSGSVKLTFRADPNF